MVGFIGFKACMQWVLTSLNSLKFYDLATEICANYKEKTAKETHWCDVFHSIYSQMWSKFI